ncbi:unnamed protein product [Dovyalis caffra]|uniref:Uncharacterized protein n=1 Tax=Dovyalis caffra TaxID=77055 RepID=A0AAV1R345_9ROSI|nr:unnamed protein product [Dovyalis caffra]
MSSMQQSFNAGETKGNTQAKVEEWADSIQDTANAATERTSIGAQSTSDSAQLERDQSAGFLQQDLIRVITESNGTLSSLQNMLYRFRNIDQTGEQVKHVAQDAMNSVKSTLGIGQNKK